MSKLLRDPRDNWLIAICGLLKKQRAMPVSERKIACIEFPNEYIKKEKTEEQKIQQALEMQKSKHSAHKVAKRSIPPKVIRHGLTVYTNQEFKPKPALEIDREELRKKVTEAMAKEKRAPVKLCLCPIVHVREKPCETCRFAKIAANL